MGTFNNSGRPGQSSGRQRATELIPDQREAKHPQVLEDDNEKPNKFLNQSQEKRWEINDCKRPMIMRVERSDFTAHIEDQSHSLTDDYVFKSPVNYGARVTGIKIKIFNATGIL